jgi:ATP-binding cassette, subfamily B, bacterial
MTEEPTQPPTPRRKRLLRLPYTAVLRPYVAAERRRLVVLAVLVLATTGIQVANPLIIRYYINAAVGGRAVRVLLEAATAYLVLAFVLQVVLVASAYVGENLAWRVTNALRGDLAFHSLRQDVEFHESRTPGELIERIDGDVTQLSEFISTALLVIMSNGLLIVGVLIALFVTDWRIGCVLLLYAILAVVSLARIRNYVTQTWVSARQASATLFGFVQERLAGTEDIRSSSAEGYVLDRQWDLSQDVLRWQRAAQFREGLIFVALHGLYVVMYGGALALGAFLYTRHLTSIGTVYLIVSYANAIYTPLNQVRSQVQELQRARACIQRIGELFAIKPSIVDGPGSAIQPGPPPVEFDDVTFRYSAGGTEALRGVSFRIEPGEVVGVLGPTGSGKTTLVRLLTRMYDVTSGAVRIGGADVRRLRLDALRQEVSVVTQDVQLFQGSIRDNLTLFDRDIPDERILDALASVGLVGWLERYPEGLDTTIQAAGGNLSAGEAQLLAIARILLRDPRLVILDEASSRLDAATERLLGRALEALFAGRTAIVIAHRMSTVAHLEKLMAVESGCVVAFGPRDEVLADVRPRLLEPERAEAEA